MGYYYQGENKTRGKNPHYANTRALVENDILGGTIVSIKKKTSQSAMQPLEVLVLYIFYVSTRAHQIKHHNEQTWYN